VLNWAQKRMCIFYPVGKKEQLGIAWVKPVTTKNVPTDAVRHVSVVFIVNHPSSEQCVVYD